MIYFDFNILPVQAVLLGAGALCLVVALTVLLVRINPVVACRRRCNAEPPREGVYENASVVVYSNDHAGELSTLLPQLLGQEYPGRFEVIVVNEGDSPRVREVVGDLQLRHSNLYLTHTPDGARNLSRKKLALTLGIKAARYPVAVLTAAGASIDSPQWLRRMMQHFSPDCHVEVVIGYAAPAPYADDAVGCRTRSLDYVADALDWLSPAVKGHPWRGTEYNLAYRRELFFRNKGFSRHLNLRHGDDDIFVSEIASSANTAVELSDESIVEVLGGNAPGVLRDRDARRRFTSRFIKHRPWLLSAIGRWSYVAVLVLAVAGACVTPLNGFAWTIAGAELIGWYATGMMWRRAMIALFGRRLLFTAPILATVYPVRRVVRWIAAAMRRQKRYTWE